MLGPLPSPCDAQGPFPPRLDPPTPNARTPPGCSEPPKRSDPPTKFPDPRPGARLRGGRGTEGRGPGGRGSGGEGLGPEGGAVSRMRARGAGGPIAGRGGGRRQAAAAAAPGSGTAPAPARCAPRPLRAMPGSMYQPEPGQPARGPPRCLTLLSPPPPAGQDPPPEPEPGREREGPPGPPAQGEAAALRFALDQLSLLGLEGAEEPAGAAGPGGLRERERGGGGGSPVPAPAPAAGAFGSLAPPLGPPALLPEPPASRKKSVNMTECVPVPSSEHVAEIVGRQGNAAWGPGGTRAPSSLPRAARRDLGQSRGFVSLRRRKLNGDTAAAPKVGRGSREPRSAPVPANCLEMAIKLEIKLHRPGCDNAGCPRKVPGSHARPWELPGHGARRELCFHCSCASAPSPPAPYLGPGV